MLSSKLIRWSIGCSMCIIDGAISLVGPILFSCANILITFATYTYFTELLPSITFTYGPYSPFVTILGLWLLINLMYNYWRCYWLGPGYAPSQLDAETVLLLNEDPENREGESHRFCRTCNIVKPMRAHHCSICKRCVLKMDHHCPWVNSCVGWQNHKHFLLFLVYMWAGSAFFLFVGFKNTWNALLGYPTTGYLLICVIMCFSAFLATSIFLAWNIYLLLTNQSTIEFYGNVLATPRRFNHYNLGAKRNIEEVFGKGISPFLILFPTRTPPTGDGIIYEMHDRDVMVRPSVSV